MTRRCLAWILCLVFLMTAVLGSLGCKEEEGTVPQEPSTEQGQTAPETAAPDTTGAEGTSGDFEEEEGVQQQSPPQYDY